MRPQDGMIPDSCFDLLKRVDFHLISCENEMDKPITILLKRRKDASNKDPQANDASLAIFSTFSILSTQSEH